MPCEIPKKFIQEVNIIKVKRGVRQGDPLSPTLFVLAIEWLAESLKQGSYQGIKVKDKEIKVSLFADDTLVFLEGNKNDFDIVFDILHKFGELSGCKISVHLGVKMGTSSQKQIMQ